MTRSLVCLGVVDIVSVVIFCLHHSSGPWAACAVSISSFLLDVSAYSR